MNRFLLVAIAGFSVLFVLGELFFVPKTYVNSSLLQALQAPRLLLASWANSRALVAQLTAQQLENQGLRAELIQERATPTRLVSGKHTYMYAPVFSSYPLNDTGRVLIAAGARVGVATGTVALVTPGIFFGEVAEVFSSQSVVRTLFDPGWEIPVKIGPEKIDALLIGGHEPRLTLISKKKIVSTGMTVVTASRRYAYGLVLGDVGDLVDSANNLFQEAPLVFGYAPGDLSALYLAQ